MTQKPHILLKACVGGLIQASNSEHWKLPTSPLSRFLMVPIGAHSIASHQLLPSGTSALLLCLPHRAIGFYFTRMCETVPGKAEMPTVVSGHNSGAPQTE